MQALQETGGIVLQAQSFFSSWLFDLRTSTFKCSTCKRSFSHLPYALPSSVSCNSFICHSYENCRGVHQQFPFWNSPARFSLFPWCLSSISCSPPPRNLCVLGVSALSFSCPQTFKRSTFK